MDALASLVERLPEGAVSTHPGELSSRSRDEWPLAVLREARGERLPRPMAVVFPTATEDVASTLAWASSAGVPVVPRGGGSGVCGGAQAVWRGIVLDLSQMHRVLEVDQESQAVHVEAGIRGDRLESALTPNGLTMGHVPDSMAASTVGGWIGSASAGLAAAGRGGIERLLLGLVAVLPGGDVLRLRPTPRSAAGPDLRRLLVGSEGVLGVVTEATLAASRIPTELRWVALRPPEFDVGVGVAREVVQRRLDPMILRLSDEPDAIASFGAMDHEDGPVLVAGFDGRPGLNQVVDAARDIGRAADAGELDDGYGSHWWEHRNDVGARYRRLLGEERQFGPGVVVDTLEVGAPWRVVPLLYRGVRDALAEHAARPVACHLSHPDGSGASLSFTFLLHGEDDRVVERAYVTTWREAAEACHRAGGTISHHHGVGVSKAPFMEAELGPEGVSVLRSIKDALDPGGTLNPGKLLPQGGAG